MNSTEREYIASAVNHFWEGLNVQAHAVNEKVVTVMYEAIEEAQSCSSDLDILPKAARKVGIGFMAGQLAKIGKSVASGDKKVYEICKKNVAYHHKIKIQEALLGL